MSKTAVYGNKIVKLHVIKMRLKMRQILTLLLALTVFSCSGDKRNKNEEETIKGKINHVGVGNVTLEQIDGSKLVVVDTLTVNPDGTYYSTFKPREPGYYRLNFYQTQFIPLLFGDTDIVVNVDGNSANGWYEIKGSPVMDQLAGINQLVQNFNNDAQKLDDEYRDAYNKNDKQKMTDLQKEYAGKQVELNKLEKQKIRDMGTSLALLQAVNYLDIDNDFDFVDSVAKVIDKNIPDYKIKKDFIDKINQIRNLSVGSMAPEIALPDPDGNIVKLSSLRGKYVLIDFWAAWCGPCRREIPNVVKMYQKYGGKDFEILGVSLDRKKEDWVKAIKDDGMKWKQVSDLKYFNSQAAKDYNINAIPATYLIDKSGKIIDKNLRGEALDDKLAQLFGS